MGILLCKRFHGKVGVGVGKLSPLDSEGFLLTFRVVGSRLVRVVLRGRMQAIT